MNHNEHLPINYFKFVIDKYLEKQLAYLLTNEIEDASVIEKGGLKFKR